MGGCRTPRLPGAGLTLAIVLIAPTLLMAVNAPGAEATSATDVARLPVQVVGTASAFYHGDTYVFGGRLPDGAYSPAVYKYNHTTGIVAKVGDMPTPAGADNGGRQSGAAAVIGSKVYHFGGAAIVNAGDLNHDGNPDYIPRAIAEILELNPATGEIRRLPEELPTGIWGHTAVSVGDVIYIFGGFSFDFANPASIERKTAILKYDPGKTLARDRAKAIPARLPIALQAHAAAYVPERGRIYIAGGLGDHHPDFNVCPTHDRYDPESGQMDPSQPSACYSDAIMPFTVATETMGGVAARLPYKVQYAAGAAFEGKMYVIGGQVSDRSAISTIVAFDPTVVQGVAVLRPTLPRPMFGGSATVDHMGVAHFGGRLGALGNLTESIVRIDPRVTSPWAPRNLVATPTASAVRLAWEPPSYDGGSPVTLYRVYRIAPNGTEDRVGEVVGGALTHNDATARAGVTYDYRVTAVNAAGESAIGARVSLRAQETAPGAVASFAVYAGNEEVLLRWTPPTETGGLNLSGYRIYRGGGTVPYAQIPPSATQFRDAPVENGRVYTYLIRAVNGKGEGTPSPELAARPAAVPDAPTDVQVAVDRSGVRISWTPSATATVRHYVILRGPTATTLAPIMEVETSSHLDDSVEAGKTYHYAIVAVNSVGESPPTSVASVSLVRPPGPPEAFVVTPGGGEIRLAWRAPFDTGDADVSTLTYYVTRVRSDGRSNIIATEISQTTYVDKPLLPGQTYTYTVTAMNPLEGAPSERKSAEPRAIINEPPLAVLVAIPALGSIGEEIEFDASQSNDADGTIVKYSFSFGDGEGIDTQSATARHAYTRNGTYTAKLTVTDSRGADSRVAAVTVVIGTIRDSEASGEDDLGVGGGGPTKTPGSGRPGSTDPKIPGPSLLWIAAVLVATSLAMRRRR